MGGRQGGGPPGGPRGDGPQQGMRNPDDRVLEKLASFVGPTYDLAPLDTTEKKFSSRNRLYIGNISNDITEEEVTELFQKYGDTSELFLNKEKNFGFIRMVGLIMVIYNMGMDINLFPLRIFIVMQKKQNVNWMALCLKVVI